MRKLVLVVACCLAVAAVCLVVARFARNATGASDEKTGNSATTSATSAGAARGKADENAAIAKIAANEKVERVSTTSTIANPKGRKLFVVGDSTLSPFNDPYYYPRNGYGMRLQDYLNPKKIEVINLAMSGRSSKSFTTEVNYKTLVNNIKKGDYLIIGFGHNDEKAEEDRYTNPNGSKETPGSFKHSLYENYVKLAKDKGAIPVLCTPIVRRSEGGTYGGVTVHVVPDQGSFEGGDYSQAIRELGEETGTIVVDLTAKTKARYERLSPAETLIYHAWLSHKENSVDNTHLNMFGAAVNAYDVVQDIAGKDKNFAKFLLKDIKEPQQSMLTPNPAYIVPTYAGFTPADKSVQASFKKVAEPWFGTAFGDCGGASKISTSRFNGIVESNGVVRMNSGFDDGSAESGKIANGNDGLCMYFQQVPIGQDFTLSAKAKVVYIKENNQVSFGLMVRDDIYIDLNDNSINSSYVACAALGIAKGEGKWTSSFERKDGELVQTTTTSEKLPVAGTVVDLSIEKKGNAYTVKYGKNPAVTYVADLNDIDADYVYAGLFTSRCVTVEYSDVRLQMQ